MVSTHCKTIVWCAASDHQTAAAAGGVASQTGLLSLLDCRAAQGGSHGGVPSQTALARLKKFNCEAKICQHRPLFYDDMSINMVNDISRLRCLITNHFTFSLQ